MESSNEEIGWFRAISTGLVILVVGLAVTVVGANELITRLTSVSRDHAAYVASAFFVGCILAGAWLLRFLQRRRLI